MCGDRDVTIHTGGNFFGVSRDDGILGTKGRMLDARGPSNSGSGAGADEQVENCHERTRRHT